MNARKSMNGVSHAPRGTGALATHLAVLGILSLAVRAAAPAAAQTQLYGSHFTGDTRGLLKFDDPITAKAAAVGNGGLLGALDFRPDGTLWGVGVDNRGNDSLASVNTDTGTITLAANNFGGRSMYGLSYRPGFNTVFLYGLEAPSGNPSQSKIWRVNSDGSLGFSQQMQRAYRAIEWTDTDTLYGIEFGGELWRINLGDDSQSQDIGRAASMTDLDYGTDGVMRGVYQFNGSYTLASIDLTNGMTTDIGRVRDAGLNSFDSVRGLASIPEPSSLLLIAAGLGWWRRTRP